MATKDKEQKGPRESKKGKGGGDKRGESPKQAHGGAGIPAPKPRLRSYYQNTVR